jgi:hypothetical protein
MVEFDVRTLSLKDLFTFQGDIVFEQLVTYIKRTEVRPIVSKTYQLRDIAEDFVAKQFSGKFILHSTVPVINRRWLSVGECLPRQARQVCPRDGNNFSVSPRGSGNRVRAPVSQTHHADGFAVKARLASHGKPPLLPSVS